MTRDEERIDHAFRVGYGAILDSIPPPVEWDALVSHSAPSPSREPQLSRAWLKPVGALGAGALAIVLVVGLAGVMSDSPTPTSSPTTTSPALGVVVTEIPMDQPIPLEILAVAPNAHSFALVDLESRSTTVYPNGTHPLTELYAGSVMTWDRDLLVWTYDPLIFVFRESLEQADLELTPYYEESEGIATSIRVAPSPRGISTAWAVQPGINFGSETQPTRVELVDLRTGASLGRYELDGRYFPVGFTRYGLVLNTEELVESDEAGGGFITEPGSERVVELLEDGSLVLVGEGRAIAAGADWIVRLVCPEGSPACDLNRENELAVSGDSGADPRRIEKPQVGTWMQVGGPSVPSDAMPMQTLDPRGTRLLVRLGQNLDVNGVPASSALLIVDLVDGSTQRVAEFGSETPGATWSADGVWIALFSGQDVTLIEASNPENTTTLESVIPAEHYPVSAG